MSMQIHDKMQSNLLKLAGGLIIFLLAVIYLSQATIHNQKTQINTLNSTLRSEATIGVNDCTTGCYYATCYNPIRLNITWEMQMCQEYFDRCKLTCEKYYINSSITDEELNAGLEIKNETH